MLIFDEKQHFEDLEKNGFEKYPNKRDLTCLCFGWVSQGARIEDLKFLMSNFCKQWNIKFNYAKSESLLLEVIDSFKNNQENEIRKHFNSRILVYDSEIKIIKKLSGKKNQKVAFSLLCLAKWRNSNYVYLNDSSSIHLKDVFSLVGLKDTSKNMSLILHSLNEQGFLDVQLKPIMKCFIPCIATEGERCLEFNITENSIKENLLSIVGCECEYCGKLFEKIKNNQKYCSECGKKMNIIKTLARRRRTVV